MRDILKLGLKHLVLPLYYRFAPTSLEAARLWVWLSALHESKGVLGTVVEIGVMNGGTSIVSIKFLREMQVVKRYFGLDTFGGFIPAQFRDDAARGTSWNKYRHFSANSQTLVKRILRLHGCDRDIELMQADICTVPLDELPDQISACLVDVDLAKPTYEALKKIWPRLSLGGVIVVDDCVETKNGWQALRGYQDFCTETGVPQQYMFGAGILRKTTST